MTATESSATFVPDSPIIGDIGLLIGLLKDNSNNQCSINTAWFEDPLSHFENMLGNGAALFNVLRSVLGEPATDAPDFVEKAKWYAIPTPLTGVPVGFYLVIPEEGESDGVLGLGVACNIVEGEVITSPYLYFPILEVAKGSPRLVVGSDKYPLQIGVEVHDNKSKFSVKDAAFTGAMLDARIPFSGATPSISLDFVNLTPNSYPSKVDSLKGLLNTRVIEWLTAVLLKTQMWLNLYVGNSSLTVGELLVKTGFLLPDDGYTLNTKTLDVLLDDLTKGDKTPLQIAEDFFFAVLSSLAEEEVEIISVLNGGIYIAGEGEGDVGSYGLRLALPDIQIAGTSAADQPVVSQNGSAPKTAVFLQLGKWLTGEEDETNWIGRSDSKLKDKAKPGLSLFLLNHNKKTEAISFAPAIELNSIGFDIKGGDDGPLLSSGGYVLKGAELRTYFSWHGSNIQFGLAGRFDDIGLPLGPSFGKSMAGTNNKVAQSLLSSGSGGDPAQQTGEQAPINPAFSVSGAYVQHGEFAVQLYDKDEKPTDRVTFEIQKSLGPLHIAKLGVGWVQATKLLSLLVDGGVKLATLEVDLIGLTVGVPITHPGDFSKYDLDLQGIDISFESGGVSLSGGFVKLPPDPKATPPRNYTEYDGEILIKAGTFAIAAMGAYAYVGTKEDGYASMFIFGLVDGELGGPGFFFVTGLAAGFGYNRGLKLPDMNGVQDFPFIAALKDPAILGVEKNENGSLKKPSPVTALQKLGAISPPERGQYWLAAGVRFTSFDLIQSAALITVGFGHELEIGLLGISSITLPPPAAPGAPAPPMRYAYAELDMEVRILPAQGLFSATAIVSPNSFVIDPACRLTGGFAFYVWFGNNPHAGNFVLTLGGYHRDFTPPSFFPKVPRLGFNWPMPGNVTIDGGAYFALTPSAVMAGGKLQVLFHAGPIKAWFRAQMDALIQWAPFHFMVEIGVSIGISARIHLLFVTITLKVELGADLSLWGPKVGGKVHISYYVISLTVGFGADEKDGPEPLAWTNENGTGFAQTLLPTKSKDGAEAEVAPMIGGAAMSVAAEAAQPNSKQAGLYTVSVDDGPVTQINVQGVARPVWIVRPNHFAFSVETVIPTTAVNLTKEDSDHTQAIHADGYSSVNIRPMGATVSGSELTITLTNLDDNKVVDLSDHFVYEKALRTVEAAKWGDHLSHNEDPEYNKTLPSRLMGLEKIRGKEPVLTPAGAQELTLDVRQAFTFDVVDDGKTVQDKNNPYHLPLRVGKTAVSPMPHTDPHSLDTIHTQLMNQAVVQKRNDLFNALRQAGVNPGRNGSLTELAQDPGAVLSGKPLIVSES
ncbi:MAG: DUF6603 domain-containing protein [Chloroflexota bacterium]